MVGQLFKQVFYPGIDRARSFRLFVVLSFFLLVGIFIAVVNTQRSVLDSNIVQEKLVREGRISYLRDWQITLFDCPGIVVGDACRAGPTVLMPLPGFSTALAEFDRSRTGHAVAVLSHLFSETTRDWLEKQVDVVLVIPRNVQQSTANADRGGVVSVGIGTTTTIPFQASELMLNGYVNLKIDYSELSRLGPMDVPIALVAPDDVETYSSLPARTIAASHLFAQLGIGFPLILAAMALVLDHSLAFGLLSLYGLSRAVRLFVPFLVDNDVVDFSWFDNIFAVANGISFALFFLLLLELNHLKRPPARLILGFVILAALLFLGIGLVLPNSWTTFDLYTDIAKSAVGIPLSLIALLVAWMHRRNAPPATPEFAYDWRMNIAAVVLVLTALSLQAWVNLEDLMFVRTGLKSVLDWRHIAVFPALTVAAILEVGLTSRRVQTVAREIAEKAVLDREIEVAQDFQRRSLPSRKFDGDGWAWKAIYKPASRLGGDWFDARELCFADGRRLMVAVLVDVTGHGVGAALSTTIVAAIWGLWCREVCLGDAPRNEAERTALLEDIPSRLHAALDASRWDGSGTGAFILFCPETSTVTYCTAGHPAIVAGFDANFSTLLTSNPALGHSKGDCVPVRWSCLSRDVTPGEHLILYSDGLVPSGASSGSFLSGLRRTLRRGGDAGLPLLFARRLYEARKEFRQNRLVEDDLTLLVISIKTNRSSIQVSERGVL